jgi:hypothetical protein
MKSRFKIYFFVATVFLLASCKKSFLTDNPYTAVTLPNAILSESDMVVALNGMYASLRNTDLFGRTLPVKGDVMADNAYVTTANSGRYLTLNQYNFNNADAYAAAIWANAYVSIKYANTIINNTTVPASANVAQYKGEALAVRALMHFELCRNFGTAYTIDPTKPGVPIVTTYNQNALPARNTIKDVYAQVITDLTAAYNQMTLYRGTGYFSKYAARALQARVYQNMGDWTDAQTAALDVINNSGWVLLSGTAYVNPTGSLGSGPSSSTYNPGGYWAGNAQSSTKNETLFEVISDPVNNNGFDQIGMIYLQLGGGYGDILGLQSLYNLYSPTDVRIGLTPNAGAGYRSGQTGTNTILCYKYSNASTLGFNYQTKVIRLADIILIAAESYYNAGDYTNANKYLNMVAQKRDLSFAGWSDTGPQVLADILVERQKELAYEGSRFWDLVRLQKSWTKITNPAVATTISVAPGNIGLVFPIPVTELAANPNMVQNPGY